MSLQGGLSNDFHPLPLWTDVRNNEQDKYGRRASMLLACKSHISLAGLYDITGDKRAGRGSKTDGVAEAIWSMLPCNSYMAILDSTLQLVQYHIC